jgi:hypothetical protein
MDMPVPLGRVESVLRTYAAEIHHWEIGGEDAGGGGGL